MNTQLFAIDGQEGDYFGYSVAADIDLIVVGAYGKSISGTTDAGMRCTVSYVMDADSDVDNMST
jgi:hypothetical protein